MDSNQKYVWQNVTDSMRIDKSLPIDGQMILCVMLGRARITPEF